MIIPIVKKYSSAGQFFKAPEKITCSYDGEVARLGAEALVSFIDGASVVESDGFVEFIFDGTLDERDEIYTLKASDGKIKVSFRDARGAVNGAASVALLLAKGEIEQCEIVDYPSCGYRSFLMDMARGLPTREDIFSTVRNMALAKFNRLHLHLIDSNGPCFKSEALPEFEYIGKGEACDKSLLREIEETCKAYAIEIVPEIEVPAHGDAVCKAHPEFKCQVENAIDWAVCPGNDDIWDFFDKLVGEVAELFPRSEYIHVGTDELDFPDLPKPKVSHWDTCPRCAALREREGLSDKLAEFYYVVDRMHGIVKAHGRKMMMWNDQIDISKDVPISRDILIHFWRIAAPGRGPYEGCTFAKFLEQGFTVINSLYPYTYLDQDRYLSDEKMKTWTPFNTPEQSSEYAHQVLGGETCGWEFGNYEGYPFYGRVTPAVLGLFGDKLWGLGEREYTDEYKAAFAEYLFGDGELSGIFDCVGSLIPPRGKDFTYVEPEKRDRKLIEDCASRLEGNKIGRCAVTRDRYLELLRSI